MISFSGPLRFYKTANQSIDRSPDALCELIDGGQRLSQMAQRSYVSMPYPSSANALLCRRPQPENSKEHPEVKNSDTEGSWVCAARALGLTHPFEMDDSFGRHVTDGLTPESGPRRQRRRFPESLSENGEGFCGWGILGWARDSPARRLRRSSIFWARETLRAEGSLPCPAVEPATPDAPRHDTRLDGSDRV